MNILAIVIFFAIVIGVIAALKAKQTSSADTLAFAVREPLFSPAERSFLGVLEQAIDDRYRVFGKVRLGDLVKPAFGMSKSMRATAQNKINQKHVDFVICSAADLAIIGVVELDDQSHGREDRAGRDVFVDQALASASIPIVHFSAKKAYVVPEVRAKLAEALKVSSPSIATGPVKVEPTPVQPVAVAEQHVQADVDVPTCPKCSAVMVKRQAKNGPHAGKLFWACSTYPKCRQVLAIG